MIVTTEYRDLDTPTGPMRTHVYTPVHPKGSTRYPGLLLYPEIYQQTGPIARLSMQFAGHGYVVMAPEIYHEHSRRGRFISLYTEPRTHGTKLGKVHSSPWEKAGLYEQSRSPRYHTHASHFGNPDERCGSEPSR